MHHANAAELLERALSLPVEDRLAPATEILNSVEGPEDDEWTEAWLKELDRRAAAAERGEEALEDWETVEARILADLSGK
ncbi:MAG: addiction module protein [Deltaproteobacteria bacterium]|nr:addiction module protein [Deltaproteobacteria bacterium]